VLPPKLLRFGVAVVVPQPLGDDDDCDYLRLTWQLVIDDVSRLPKASSPASKSALIMTKQLVRSLQYTGTHIYFLFFLCFESRRDKLLGNTYPLTPDKALVS
jgi:hypothetical protein